MGVMGHSEAAVRMWQLRRCLLAHSPHSGGGAGVHLSALFLPHPDVSLNEYT